MAVTFAESKSAQLIIVGKITSVYGVRGWFKVHSYTEPMENILHFPRCWLRNGRNWKSFELDGGRRHGKGLIAHIKGIDDRDRALDFCQREIAVDGDDMPQLSEGDYYWHQLQGLQVVGEFAGQIFDFGKVLRLMETGANDVMVAGGGKDQRERLIPYLPGDYIRDIDLDAGVITVNWDPEF